MEEERIQVLNNMEELEQKIKELDNQMDESAREVKRRQREDKEKTKRGTIVFWTDRHSRKNVAVLTIHCLMLI